jgi:23S rRNA pseudouridine955/2504/2580 synthase
MIIGGNERCNMSSIPPVLYEDDNCMVLNKPPGLAVQGGEGVGVSLDSLLAEAYKPRPLLVHRLDKDTSGLILAAKNREAAGFFSGLLGGGRDPGAGKVRRVLKQYLAVCSGVPEEKAGTIKLSLEVRGRELFSETSYRLLSSGETAGQSFSLLELELGTGRMHQIRRHLAAIGHPVLGDDKYGDFPLNKALRKAIKLKRLLLHAYRLVVPPSPPLLPGGLDISAPLPDYFEPFGTSF